MKMSKGAEKSHSNIYSGDVFQGVVWMKLHKCFSFFHWPIMPWLVPLLCVIQKHAAALFVPGVPGVSRISASARSVQARPSPPCVEATAPPTTMSVNSACPPACRRGELMWRSSAAVMKVGNGLWNGVIMLTNQPLKWCNYLHQLTWGTVCSHLWDFIMVAWADRSRTTG